MNALNGHASLHTVQHLLGHTSHAFTADVYGTVPDSLARAEASATAEVVLEELRPIARGGHAVHRVDASRRRDRRRLHRRRIA